MISLVKKSKGKAKNKTMNTCVFNYCKNLESFNSNGWVYVKADTRREDALVKEFITKNY